MKTLQFTAIYKLGHTTLHVKTNIYPTQIHLIQELVEEIPEKLEGMNSVVETVLGHRIYVTDSIDVLLDKWEKALANL